MSAPQSYASRLTRKGSQIKTGFCEAILTGCMAVRGSLELQLAFAERLKKGVETCRQPLSYPTKYPSVAQWVGVAPHRSTCVGF